MTLFTTRQLRLLFGSVISIRISSLLLTLYAVVAYPDRFYESNPTVSPLFRFIGTDGAAIVYTILLLFSMLLLYDSVAKTHPRYFALIGLMYYGVLLITTLDFVNDIFIVLLPALYKTVYPDVAVLLCLGFIQFEGTMVGRYVLTSTSARLLTSRQNIALRILIWPLYLYRSIRL